MRTTAGAWLGAVAVACAFAAPARAHGGRFIPPLPIPGDPVPGGGGVPMPGDPTGNPGGGPYRGGGPLRGKAGAGASGWRAWWAANSPPFLQRPRRARELTSVDPLFRVGEGRESGNATDADRLVTLAVERDILPTLAWAVDRANGLDADARAAANLAIGKTARLPAQARELIARARGREKLDLAHEATVLALGLLRRSTPELVFDASLLDEARAAAFEALDDDDLPVRTRAFGAFAIGLLGDQPTARTSVAERDGRWVVHELWTRFREHGKGAEDLATALLSALALQSAGACPSGIVDQLQVLVKTGRLDNKRRGSLQQAQAMLALARLAPEDAAGVVLALLHGRGVDPDMRRSAIVAAGLVARRVEPTTRAELARTLARFLDAANDVDTRGLMLISVGHLLAADAADGSSAVLETGAADLAVKAIEGSVAPVRPFGALALGVALRDVAAPKATPALMDFRRRALGRLAAVAADDDDPAVRGALVLSLGLARDRTALALLQRVAGDKDLPDELRGDGCTALGLVGDPTRESLATLRAAFSGRPSETLRRQAAVGLGLLGDTSASALLVGSLGESSSDFVLAQLVLAIGAIGDPGAAPPLARLVRDRSNTDLLRAIACAGLGLLGDPERVPSLSRLGVDSNYLLGTDALREVISLL